MYIDWTKHLSTSEEKEKFSQSVHRARHVLDRLKQLIQADLEATSKTELGLKAYDNPNWAYRQAHTNGYKKALNNILTLVDLDKQKKDIQSDRLVNTEFKPIISGPPEPGTYPELP